MDVIEAANILPKGDPERKRLLSIVVCGGGPTGVEVAGEIQDYIDQDLKKWMPEVASEIKVTLVEALPNVLNMFNKKLVDYTKQVFEDTNIDLRTNTMIKKVDDKTVSAQVKSAKDGSTSMIDIPYGDCTFTKCAPTAQVAFQEAHPTPTDNIERLTKKLSKLQEKLPGFVYNHQGSLAYIGSERAVADLVWGDWSNVTTGDWVKVSMFGRDISKE
ncbi:hypothetical protein QCA50_016216 [Cerrena zonata]|uniref:NADH:ubiquinone reductase (non-electrogenic) n=1 Tax=Cerrena zonata TaxID=2478898 RepID=A0AAW0FIS3_9APHY